MTEQHPITPPLELVQQWSSESLATQHLCKRAAQWGYDQRSEVNESKLQQARDQELEACCALMDDWGLDGDDLRAARRPKPPSLKEQALDLLNEGPVSDLLDEEVDTIRRALEALPDD